MPIFRITRNEKYDFATLHNRGCNFGCPFCSYKLRSGADGRPGFSVPAPERFLDMAEIKAALKQVRPGKVYVMGGEPTTAPELPELLLFAKNELNAETKLGHTNGSELPLPGLDGANVGFKAWSEELHLRLTRHPKSLVYDNFSRAFDSGVKLAANVIFIPGLVDLVEIENLARHLAAMSADIPLHINGYIPVPGQPWQRPTAEEMREATLIAESHLSHVSFSHLTSEEALDLSARDDRFNVKIIAGA